MIDAPGLLTGAEPTREAYEACALDNYLASEERHPQRRAAWMARDLDRLQFDGTWGSRI